MGLSESSASYDFVEFPSPADRPPAYLLNMLILIALYVMCLIEDSKKQFEIENKVRTIVADMLLNMNENLT